MMEDKIIKDVLLHLDGWGLQDKSPKTRHKPKHPRYIDPFNETSDEIEENTNLRKTVTSNEILETYETAKIHVLNYIKRPVFPRTPVTHLALCMWTAGLLSQKARFRKQKVEHSYNLIKEAKKLLQPHVKHNPIITTISGADEYMEYDIENYRLFHHHKKGCKKHHPCEMQHPHHHKKHKKHHHDCDHHHDRPYFEKDEPDFEEFFLKPNQIVLKVVPAVGNLGQTIPLKAFVRDKYGNRIDEGRVQFFMETDDEEDRF